MKLLFTVRIKAEHDPPDMGGGPGVIATQEVIDTKVDSVKFTEKPMEYVFIINGIEQHKEELLKQWVEVVYEIVE